MRLRLRSILFILFAFFAVSCGGNSGESTVTLTEEERSVIISMIGENANAGLDQASSSTALSTSTLVVREGFSDTVDCSAGGTIEISGTVTIDGDGDCTDSCTGSEEDTHTFRNCARFSPMIDSTLTLDGSLESSATFSVNGFTVSSEGEINGTIAVQGASAGNGSCAVAIDMTLNANETIFSYTYAGTFCGESLNISESINL